MTDRVFGPLRDLEDFCEWCEDPPWIHSIRPRGTWRPNVRSLSDRDYAVGTIARRVACLRGFFEYPGDERRASNLVHDPHHR
jgi:site-specific recombinase XerD